MSNKKKKILIIQTAFLGDLILTTPIFKRIKEIFPNSLIYVITLPTTAPILFHNPYIHKIIIYDKKGREKGIKGLLSIIRKVREISPNIVISPHRYLKSALISFLSKADIRIGFKVGLHRILYTHTVKRNKESHEVERILSLLSPITKEKERYIPPTIYLTHYEILYGLRILRENNIPISRLIVFAPGSVWGTKRWPATYYKELANMLTDIGFHIGIIGGKEDYNIGKEIKGNNNKIYNFCGLPIRISSAIISLAKLLVSNDTAPMHIGVALDTPVIAIFGPTIPSFGFAPFHIHKSKIIEIKGLSCRPCSIHGKKTCPKKHFKCMQEIKPDIIFKEITKILYNQLD